MAIRLSERLSAAASLVRGGGIVADIGTDHGYLPVYLIETGKVKSAVAADIRKMPLENAAKAVKKYGLEDKIELRLSDGLQSFFPADADEFVFAGMGGTLIAEKLREIPWIKNEKYHFVFQPQSRAEDLRRYLFENGFEIEKEVATHEGRRIYIAFSAAYTGDIRSFTEADCFLGKLPETEDARSHIQNQFNRLTEKYNGTADESEKVKLSELLCALKEFTND